MQDILRTIEKLFEDNFKLVIAGVGIYSPDFQKLMDFQARGGMTRIALRSVFWFERVPNSRYYCTVKFNSLALFGFKGFEPPRFSEEKTAVVFYVDINEKVVFETCPYEDYFKILDILVELGKKQDDKVVYGYLPNFVWDAIYRNLLIVFENREIYLQNDLNLLRFEIEMVTTIVNFYKRYVAGLLGLPPNIIPLFHYAPKFVSGHTVGLDGVPTTSDGDNETVSIVVSFYDTDKIFSSCLRLLGKIKQIKASRFDRIYFMLSRNFRKCAIDVMSLVKTGRKKKVAYFYHGYLTPRGRFKIGKSKFHYLAQIIEVKRSEIDFGGIIRFLETTTRFLKQVYGENFGFLIYKHSRRLKPTLFIVSEGILPFVCFYYTRLYSKLSLLEGRIAYIVPDIFFGHFLVNRYLHGEYFFRQVVQELARNKDRLTQLAVDMTNKKINIVKFLSLK